LGSLFHHLFPKEQSIFKTGSVSILRWKGGETPT